MDIDEKRSIYATLAAPFPEQTIQRTEGRVTGCGYDTAGIGYQFICNRLNEVLGIGGWRAHRTVVVKKVTTSEGRDAFEAICDLTLELGCWENGEFTVFAESLSDGGHASMSETHARKGAYTNALKKAAAMLGCGRQAYEGTLDDDNTPAELPVETAPQRPTPAPVPTTQHQQAYPLPHVGRTAAPAPTRNRLTSKQLAAIWAISRKLGYEQTALRQHIKTTFSVQPEFLSREQASQAIGALSKQAGNGQAKEFPGRDFGQEG